MDRTELIEQLVVIEDCGAAGEDDNTAASKRTTEHMTDALRRDVDGRGESQRGFGLAKHITQRSTHGLAGNFEQAFIGQMNIVLLREIADKAITISTMGLA